MIDINMNQLVLFNSRRDSVQIGILGLLLGERSSLLKVLKRVTQEAIGQLLIGLDVRSSRNL